VDFPPDSGEPDRRASGAKTTKRTRQNRTPAIKAKAALAAMKGEKTLAELAQQFDVHVNQIAQWKNQLLEAAPGVDLKVLHARIGELARENDFLEGALIKAGMPGAKR
jgi:transposase